MNPEIWGPHAWFLLHSITFNYPVKPTEVDKNNIKNFIHSFATVIPCYMCQKHFAEHLKKAPITDNVLKSRDNLADWLIDIHNRVNKMNGKKIWTPQEVMDHYEKIYTNYDNNDNNISNKKCTECKENKKSNFFYIIFCIIIIIIILYINRKKLHFFNK